MFVKQLLIKCYWFSPECDRIKGWGKTFVPNLPESRDTGEVSMVSGWRLHVRDLRPYFREKNQSPLAAPPVTTLIFVDLHTGPRGWGLGSDRTTSIKTFHRLMRKEGMLWYRSCFMTQIPTNSKKQSNVLCSLTCIWRIIAMEPSVTMFSPCSPASVLSPTPARWQHGALLTASRWVTFIPHELQSEMFIIGSFGWNQ